jgi:hypothetical protein
MTEKPDFVIAGAARSGTTALYECLCQHPAVFMPSEKEPGFFSADVAGGMSSLEQYRALFALAPPNCVTGEASTRYLYSRIAIPRLVAHNPKVKIIVMLRDPVDAAYSLHGYAYRYRHEHLADFEDAWRAQGVRLGYDAHEPRSNDRPVVEYDYRGTYRYAEQVRRVVDNVPPEQRYFVLYEDFFADPEDRYAGVVKFLGLLPTQSCTFRIVNQYVGVRSPRLERFLRQPPSFFRALHSRLRPLFTVIGFRPVQVAARINWGRQHRLPLRPAFRAALERYFSDDIAELENILGRSLWNTDVRRGTVDATDVIEPRRSPVAKAPSSSSDPQARHR